MAEEETKDVHHEEHEHHEYHGHEHHDDDKCGEHWHHRHHKHGHRHGGAYMMGGPIWFIGWLFTIGYLHMPFFWKGVLAIIIWPYYLGNYLNLFPK